MPESTCQLLCSHLKIKAAVETQQWTQCALGFPNHNYSKKILRNQNKAAFVRTTENSCTGLKPSVFIVPGHTWVTNFKYLEITHIIFHTRIHYSSNAVIGDIHVAVKRKGFVAFCSAGFSFQRQFEKNLMLLFKI